MKAGDLYGSAPDKSDTVLLLVDVINMMDFPGSQSLVRDALPAAKHIAQLKRRLRVPAVYVNDNFGRWKSNFAALVQHCLDPKVPGHAIVTQLLPGDDDYFVLKPKNSGFYETSLEILLEHMQAKTLVITGFATDNCILFTANDAYLRGYDCVIPRDCTAAVKREDKESALRYMRRVIGAHTPLSQSLRGQLRRRPAQR